jgi:DnaJ-class molecular chaperone
MPQKNYYLVLGIPRTASPAGIHAAYHAMARRMHPDVVGASGKAAFQEINEAYEALSDPSRRRAHDDEISPPQGERVGIPVRRQPRVEPIAPEPISVFSQPEETRPSFEALRERWLRNFTGRDVPKAEHAESLTLDVVLSPQEAIQGCVVPVGVPVFHTCLECSGSGHVWPFPCLECAGSGLVEQMRTMQVRIPPVISTGRVFEFPLDLFHIRNLYLRIHVSVSSAA